MKKTGFNAELAEEARRSQRKQLARVPRAEGAQFHLHALCETSASSTLSFLKVVAALVLAVSLAGCGTKTELLKPDGKPTPRDERDPSQPPSPISR